MDMTAGVQDEGVFPLTAMEEVPLNAVVRPRALRPVGHRAGAVVHPAVWIDPARYQGVAAGATEEKAVERVPPLIRDQGVVPRASKKVVRAAAGIVADARLHDLRHAHTAHAVMSGESMHRPDA